MGYFLTYRNVHTHRSAGERFRLPSQTIPEQTLSLKTLLERYTRGQTVATFSPIYNGEDSDELTLVSRMDAMERLDYARELKGIVTGIQQKQQAEKLELEKRELEKRLAEEKA